MPMRLELGAFTVEVERQEDAAAFLCGLLRRLNDKQVGEVLGVTDKTVRRWKREGRLPNEKNGRLSLLHLLQKAPPTLLPGRSAARAVTAPAEGPAVGAPVSAAARPTGGARRGKARP
jgi:hypothetical protein